MGNDVPEQTRREQRKRASSMLDALYAAALKHWPGFEKRAGQKQMMEHLLETLLNYKAKDDERDGSNIAIVEGKTGSGKTVGYCLPALAVSHATGKQVIIATATVALQEQLFDRDLPKLEIVAGKVGLKLDTTLVKGRQRYVCRSRLDRQIDPEEGEAVTGSQSTIKIYANMAQALDRQSWPGDKDTWPEAVDDGAWQRIQADRASCTTRKCEHYNKCSFFKARESMKSAKIVVTNHALVLSTLQNEAGALDIEDALLIFDEGHHLATIAADHASRRFALRGSSTLMSKMAKALPKATRLLGDEQMVTEGKAAADALRTAAIRMRDVHEMLAVDANLFAGKTVRFPHGDVPQAIQQAGIEIAPQLKLASTNAVNIMRMLREVSGDGASDKVRKAAMKLIEEIGAPMLRLRTMQEMLSLWQNQAKVPRAKWVEPIGQSGDDFMLCAAPLTGAAELTKLLWEKASAVAITSATLTACGSFEYFCKVTGLARYANCSQLQTESPFDYQRQGEIRIPKMRFNPKQVSEFSNELQALLPARLVKAQTGQLVLFSSKRQMEAMYASLQEPLKGRVLMQGNLPRSQLLAEHSRRIKAGQGSIIFGLQSFGEGIDLPGALCENVYIDKVPFTPPDSPVEEALAEWLQTQHRDPFQEITIPKASQKLAQWVGRGIRTKTDWATITIFDTRVITQGYGKQLLQGLPPLPLVRETTSA